MDVLPPPKRWPASISRRILRHLGIIVVIVATIASFSPTLREFVLYTRAPRLHGTFLQLLNTHRSWRPEDWSRLFGYFRELQLSQLVIQWTVYDGTVFYATGNSSAAASTSSLDTVLQLADQSGLQVFVGLVYDSQFWEQIRRPSPLVQDYLQRHRLQAVSVARELGPMVRRHPSFQGWYLTEEVDDTNWRGTEARQTLFNHLRDTSARLREVSPGRKVALSGFSNGRIAPKTFEAFWSALLVTADIDVVFFQDGIGTGKLELAQLPLYLAAIRKAVTTHGRELRVVIEIFRQVAGPPLDDKQFKAVPRTLDGIQRQMATAAPYASQLIAFSIPEYMTPLGGLDAGRLYTNYLGITRPTR